MTTIAANRECMSADTRVSIETGQHYPATKIFRVGESLFGTAGHAMMCLVMIEWLKTARNRQQLYKQWSEENYFREEVWILELNPRGLFLWDGWGVPEQVLSDHMAIGSGAKSALAVMAVGKGPEEAVRVATQIDIYSNPPIQTEWLLPPELVKKKRRKR